MSKYSKYSETDGYFLGDIQSEELPGSSSLAIIPVLNFKSHRKYIDRTRKGSATFVKSSAYNPIIPTGTSYPLEFDSEDRKSLDITIYRHLPGKGFSVSLPGIYMINVEWHIDIPTPGAMTFVELDLYKNDIIYKRIGREAILSAATMTSNVYHLEANLQGSKDIDLTSDDIFTVQLIHDKATGFGAGETHTGYIDIDFSHKWSLN